MTLQEWQRGLITLRYNLGPAGADGKPGRFTTAATIAFKTKHGLSPTAVIGPQSLELMRKELAGIPSAKPVRTAILKEPEGLEPLWLIEARSWLGEREKVGRGSNPRILTAIRKVGMRILGMDFTDDDTAWCGAIMAAWISTVLSAEPLPSVAVRAASWAKFGVPLSVPALGAIMVFTRKGGGHVALYLGETPTHIVVLGGNQGNAVSIMAKDKIELQAIRWPSTVPLPRGGRIITNAKGVPVNVSQA